MSARNTDPANHQSAPIEWAFCEITNLRLFQAVLGAGQADVILTAPDDTRPALIDLTLQGANGQSVHLELTPADADVIGSMLSAMAQRHRRTGKA
jgi:hypothetical protein